LLGFQSCELSLEYKIIFHTKNVYCARGPDVAKAFRRILSKRISFTCILINTGLKVIVADWPELLVSVGVFIVVNRIFVFDSFKSESYSPYAVSLCLDRSQLISITVLGSQAAY
jgi:hypothetical protein